MTLPDPPLRYGIFHVFFVFFESFPYCYEEDVPEISSFEGSTSGLNVEEAKLNLA